MSEDNLIESNSHLNSFLSVTYPESKRVYCYDIGRLLENVTRDITEDFLGDIAELHFTLRDKDADVIINDSSLALEVLNHYNPKTDYVRSRRIMENLRGFKFKGVIASRISETMKRLLKGVPILELGFQLLPKKYLHFYASIKKTKGRKFESPRTLKILRNMLKSFLIRIGAIKIPRIVNRPSFSYVTYTNDISEEYSEDITRDYGKGVCNGSEDVRKAFRDRLRGRYRRAKVFYSSSPRELPLDSFYIPEQCLDCNHWRTCLLILTSLEDSFNNPLLVSKDLQLPYKDVKDILHCAYSKGLVSRRLTFVNSKDIDRLEYYGYYISKYDRIPVWRYYETHRLTVFIDYVFNLLKDLGIINTDPEDLKYRPTINTKGIDMETKVVTENTLKAFKQVRATLMKRLENCYLQSTRDALVRRIESIGKCRLCGIPFKVGDSVVKYGKHGTNWAHLECYERIIMDIPDSILDPQDIQFIGGD